MKTWQTTALSHSTLLLRHLELCLAPVPLRQKQSSILFLYHCVIDNALAAALVARLVPQPLLAAAGEEARDPAKWSLAQWEALVKHLNSDHSSATRQWSAECRAELRATLRADTAAFYAHFRPVEATEAARAVEEMFAGADFALSAERRESLLQLRWNFEEYEVEHRVLRGKLPVFKYYIEVLVADGPGPRLTEHNILNPRRFWEELTAALLAATEPAARVLLLKCMILVYRRYFRLIKEVKVVGQLLAAVRAAGPGSALAYLSLQLLHVALEVDDRVAQMQNAKASSSTAACRCCCPTSAPQPSPRTSTPSTTQPSSASCSPPATRPSSRTAPPPARTRLSTLRPAATPLRPGRWSFSARRGCPGKPSRPRCSSATR